jgi:hypothetical protein
MNGTTIVNDIPPGTKPINGLGADPSDAGGVASLRPVRFSLESIWESPCFWMLAGAALALFAVYTLKKKL